MNMRAILEQFLKWPFSHSKTAFSIFCWYFRYIHVPTTNICTYIVRASEASVAPQKHISSGLKYICIHIQSMQFPLITYGMAL